MRKAFATFSFGIIAMLLVFAETILISKGPWTGDFWEHVAAIKELSAHPLHPAHPIFLSALPHMSFSPYCLMVALFVRLSGIGVIEAMSFFAFFNLLAFVAAFYYFCRSVFRPYLNGMAALALLLVLVFWGLAPHMWAGFYHIFGLSNTLPYPSTFAMAVSLFALGLLLRAGAERVEPRVAVVSVLTALVVLTHTYTGIFLVLGVIALTFVCRRSIPQFLFRCSVIILPALLLVILWPYYSFWQFLLAPNASHALAGSLYTDVLVKHWPAFFALPSLYFIRGNKALLFLWTLLLMLLAIYAAGYFTGCYGLGRMISHVMLVADLITAYTITRVAYSRSIPAQVLLIAPLVVALCLCLFNGQEQLMVLASKIKEPEHQWYWRYEFLKDELEPKAIVLAHPGSSYYVPVFGGRVVAYVLPEQLFPNNEQNKELATRFFNPETSDAVRQAILKQFHPDYLLADMKPTGLDSIQVSRLAMWGPIRYRQDSIILIRVASRR